jgi:hypothetical protein
MLLTLVEPLPAV